VYGVCWQNGADGSGGADEPQVLRLRLAQAPNFAQDDSLFVGGGRLHSDRGFTYHS
jgi:hypothetical protein